MPSDDDHHDGHHDGDHDDDENIVTAMYCAFQNKWGLIQLDQ